MTRLLHDLIHRPAIHVGRGIVAGRVKDAQFASFLDLQAGRRSRADRHEAAQRRRRLAKGFAIFLLGSGFAWFVIESVQALSHF